MLIAVGGNSLIRAGEKGTIVEQLANARRTAAAIVGLIRDGYHLVVTHGNGPQVGAQLLRSERAADQVPGQTLDVCGAASQGEIGYLLAQSLQDELAAAGLRVPVVSLVTQTIVSASDPAMQHPTKPIGPFYTKEQADQIAQKMPGIVIKEDAGRGYRRVVPSPDPKVIAERSAIRTLVDAGFVVVSTGGGGIPIIEEGTEAKGVEAVIDKDLGGQRLATLIGANIFVILTDVDGAYVNYGKPNQELITEVTTGKLQNYMADGQFKEGSMAPKILAAIRFVESGGERAIIAELGKLTEALDGRAGTHVVGPRA